MIKLMIVGRRRGGMTVSQLHRYMTDVHGAMVVRFIGESPEECPKRYVQNHVFDSTTLSPDGSTDPFTSSRDFVTQVWFDSPMQAKAALDAPLYRHHLQPDEDNFVDQSSVVKLPVAEQKLFDSGSADARYKVFIFHRHATQGVAADAASETLAHWQTLLARDEHGIEQWVRNTVMGPPNATPPINCVDEVWLKTEAAARALCVQWQVVAGTATPKPLAATTSSFTLLAYEHILFGGKPAL